MKIYRILTSSILNYGEVVFVVYSINIVQHCFARGYQCISPNWLLYKLNFGAFALIEK